MQKRLHPRLNNRLLDMKRTLLAIVVILMVGAVFAQHPDFNQQIEELHAKKTEFIKRSVRMTSEEEKAFLPIFNEYEQKKWGISQKKDAWRSAKKDDATDFARINDLLINSELTRAKLAKIYHEKFKRILPPEKLFKYYVAERQFKEKMINEMVKRRVDAIKRK
jgi:hypothetical protein